MPAPAAQRSTISVILCTYNRYESLAKALESVAALRLPESVAWEVLVVDNNSHDRTREVVEEFCHRCPGHFGYAFEPQPGKSHALKTGIREARGTYWPSSMMRSPWSRPSYEN
jgi:glucosyl-dolichyl phosphate glucuronosyltransferase